MREAAVYCLPFRRVNKESQSPMMLKRMPQSASHSTPSGDSTKDLGTIRLDMHHESLGEELKYYFIGKVYIPHIPHFA